MFTTRKHIKHVSIFVWALLGLVSANAEHMAGRETPRGERNVQAGQLTDARIDWLHKSAFIQFGINLDTRPENRLGAASRAEEMQKTILFEEAPLALMDIIADSKTMIKNHIETIPGFMNEILESLRQNARYSSHPSRDLKSLVAQIQYDLSCLYPLLTGKNANKTVMEKVFSWQPAKQYSGLIIYMKDMLDWYGTDEKTRAKPALTICLHDTEGRTFFDISNMDPEWALEWGTASYARSVEEARRDPRIGNTPLIISARGVFGLYPVDPVLSVEDSNLLLFNESTRSALEEGRIIMVLAESMLSGQLKSINQD